VIRGCVPKKILVYGASFRGEFEVSRFTVLPSWENYCTQNSSEADDVESKNMLLLGVKCRIRRILGGKLMEILTSIGKSYWKIRSGLNLNYKHILHSC
jgi:hypothetical protein